MWAEFDRLRRIWSARQEAAGGVAALAGFQFQLAAALLALARANGVNRKPGIFIEALSDIVSTENGYLIVTQAKLTLHSGAFRKSLKELWEIDALATREVPDLVPNLKYRVLTSEKILKDVEAALARWQPDDEVNEGALDAFRARVSVRVEAEPQQSLAAHLVNAFGDPDPFTTVEKWLGRLLSNPTTAGFDESCRSIITELDASEAAAREREHRFHIWEAEDRPPPEPRLETDPEKATLTGQTPTRNHLAEGRFASRSFYSTVHDKAEAWFAHAKERNDGRLPVFWIAGRSGTGKSVALLHLLADLHGADDRRIIVWLDQQADRLAEAVRWLRPFFATGHDVVLASDDPYTPERHQRVTASIDDALRELDSASVAYPNMIRPALIFCGPTEQSQYFEDDLADRVLIERFPVPEESHPDLEELKEWYQLRTGRTDLAVGDTKNVLIVQLFFEWATGQPIREFAQRFRQRLEGMERSESPRKIFDVVAEILALNRLYALCPAQSIDEELERNPHLGSAFDRLKDLERHLSFDADGGGYRLTHPHLANAVYTTWFGREDDRRHRKAHLRAGIDAALARGDTPSRRFAPLWAIARLTSGRVEKNSDTAQRLALIESELRELLIDLYGSQFVQSQTPLTDLPVWTDLDRQLDLHLRPSPLILTASAVRSASERAPGLRLSCHKLLQHSDIQPDGGPIVSEILNKHRSWSEWRPLAADYIKLVGIGAIEAPLREFVVREWMRPTTLGLIQQCLGQIEGVAVRRVVLSWLETASINESVWSSIFTNFVDKYGFCDIAHRLGSHFLVSERDHDGWSHVWERLHDSPLTDLRARGRKWLDDAPAEHGSWGFIWQELWQASGKADDDLRARGRKWLDDAPAEHGSWGYVWQELWQASGKADDDLRASGRQWLDDVSSRHLSWGHVWRGLWNAERRTSDNRDDLVSRALAWLQVPDLLSPVWPVVWNILWDERCADNEILLDIAGRLLIEAPPKDSRPVERRIQSLRKVPIPANPWDWKDAWERRWREATRSNAGRDHLVEEAKEWLSTFDLKQRGWTSVWRELWVVLNETPIIRAELICLAELWLEKVDPSHPRWASIWITLWHATTNSLSDKKDYLVQRGRSWLFGSGLRADWQNVWSSLWKLPEQRDEALRSIARQRINELTPVEVGLIENQLLT